MKLEYIDMISELISDAEKTDRFYITSREFRQFEIEVKQACFREIPRQPMNLKLDGISNRYHCSNCGEFLKKGSNYCHVCGEAIDWSRK